MLDFSALNVAQSNGRLPFHAFDMQEDEGVCGVRVERKGDCVCGNVVRGGEDGQMERDYAVAIVDILQGVVVNARSVEVFSVEMEGGSGGNGLRNGVCVNDILEMCRENGVLREGYRANSCRFFHIFAQNRNMMNGICFETDRLYDVICGNFKLLCVVSRFGIDCGFGDKTIRQVCDEKGIDCNTFLAVVNFHTEARQYPLPSVGLSLKCLCDYLENSHAYYLDFILPSIRRKLLEALGTLTNNEAAFMIIRFYDEYCVFVRKHMEREEKEVFPYVDSLLKGKKVGNMSLEMALMHRTPLENKLADLKKLIIKFYNGQTDRTLLSSVLYDIFLFEEDLMCHCKMETILFVEEVKRLEEKNLKNPATNATNKAKETEELSEREREVICCVVQGMSNKAIAEKLFISVNTVTTHRRNIARKTDIHSSAALTLYAIMNGLVTMEEIDLKNALNAPR